MTLFHPAGVEFKRGLNCVLFYPERDQPYRLLFIEAKALSQMIINFKHGNRFVPDQN